MPPILPLTEDYDLHQELYEAEEQFGKGRSCCGVLYYFLVFFSFLQFTSSLSVPSMFRSSR